MLMLTSTRYVVKRAGQLLKSFASRQVEVSIAILIVRCHPRIVFYRIMHQLGTD